MNIPQANARVTRHEREQSERIAKMEADAKRRAA